MRGYALTFPPSLAHSSFLALKNDEKTAEIGKYSNGLTWKFFTNSEFCIWFQSVKNCIKNLCFCKQLYGVNNTSFVTVFMWRGILGKIQHFPKIFMSIFSTNEALWFSKPKSVTICYASQFITFKIPNFLPSKIHPKNRGNSSNFSIIIHHTKDNYKNCVYKNAYFVYIFLLSRIKCKTQNQCRTFRS